MTTRSLDRTAIIRRVVLELGTLPFWNAEQIIVGVNPLVPMIDWAPPFVQVCEIGQTTFTYPTTQRRRMPSFPVGIAVYADIERPEWTLQGNGDERGVTYIMDKIADYFDTNRTLGGLVDRAWITALGAPEVVPEVQFIGGVESCLVALATLDIKVDRPPGS